MPPKARVDLDLDALAPPPKTVRLRGRVYELPGDIGLDAIIRALQLSDNIGADAEEESIAAMRELVEIIYDLFRECDPNFEPVPLTLTQILNILGLIMSGLDIDFEAALKEALVDSDAAADDTKKAAEEGRPPTRRGSAATAKAGAGATPSRSRKLSVARS